LDPHAPNANPALSDSTLLTFESFKNAKYHKQFEIKYEAKQQQQRKMNEMKKIKFVINKFETHAEKKL
jgi:hypothetical protein